MLDALEIFASRFTPPGSVPGGMPGSVPAICIPSLTGASDAFLAVTMATGAAFGKSVAKKRSPRIVLAVTPGLPDADRLADDLRALTSQQPEGSNTSAFQTRILEFPPLLGDDKSSLGVRLKTIAALKAWGLSPYPCVVVASYPALALPIPAQGSVPSIHLGTDPKKTGTVPLSFGDICAKLAEIGYNRTPQVEQEGDFSVRGGIVDVWSPGDEFPVRAEFFGEDLESLRSFNPATQVSISRIDSAELLPIETGDSPLGNNDGDSPLGRRGQSLVSLLPEDAAIFAIEHNEYNLSQILPEASSGESHASSRLVCYTGDPAPQGVATYDFQTAPLPGFAELGADEAHHPELFDAARKRLDQHIAAAERRGAAVLRLDDLSGGFELGGALLVVTKADRVFTKKKEHFRQNAAAMRGPRLSDFDDLEPGEYVVHVDYGVGRYVGSSEILFDGRRSEVFTIEYADDGKLHVPAAHAHLLSRYVGVKGEAVRLHRLDGKRWEKDKKDAQKAVSDLAAALLETQAKRETTPGTVYDVACEGRDAFDAAFPYEETPDQLAAIAAVDKDLASRKPMDRLVCGDAGYGKTEVAMRAAFKAVMDGKQVAVLVPTTVLAQQHYETFRGRLGRFPVTVEVLSRFATPTRTADILARTAAGKVDVLIGTHRLLGAGVEFRDLGLLVVDEEQRFGVAAKEHLKRLHPAVDVLTLSATPIPRTLYLSLTGARDMSLVQTPPRERLAIETYVAQDTDELLREAILRELDRGGQVFFLHNRIGTIGRVRERLERLVPRLRIGVGHGRMGERELAGVMRDFVRGRYDLLLCTTIIESGVDIPNVNTILIDRADRFGMADLHQIRGRVGRGRVQAYAYLLLPRHGGLFGAARERIQAIRRTASLGAGYKLALRDLEIRGAGNVLGHAQSGHIAAVGFDLYCQLLDRTIARLKGQAPPPVVDVQTRFEFLDLSPDPADAATSAAIPRDYIEDENLRIGIYRKLASIATEPGAAALADEIRDRFGPLPAPVRRLLAIARIRVLASALGVRTVATDGDRLLLTLPGKRFLMPNGRHVRLHRHAPDDRLAEIEKRLRSLSSSPP